MAEKQNGKGERMSFHDPSLDALQRSNEAANTGSYLDLGPRQNLPATRETDDEAVNRLFGFVTIDGGASDSNLTRMFQPNNSSIDYDSEQRVKGTTDARGRSRTFDYNDEGELIAVKMENGETWSRQKKEGDVWIWTSDRGSPARHLLRQEVDFEGTLFVETSAQNQIFYRQEGLKEVLRHADMLELARVLRSAIVGPGTNEKSIFLNLEGKSSTETEFLEKVYKQEFGCDLAVDLIGDMEGADLERSLELLQGDYNSESEIMVALADLDNWGGKSNATAEAIIRNTLRTMTHSEIHQEFSTLVETLKVNSHLSEPTRASVDILVKGYDRLTEEDHRKLSQIALANRDCELFEEAMKYCPQTVRDQFNSKEGRAELVNAFGSKWYETAGSIALAIVHPASALIAQSHLRQRFSHATDYAKEGKLSLSTQVKENTSFLGDNEAAIENMIANISLEERQQYRIGRWLDGEKKGHLSKDDLAVASAHSAEENDRAKQFYRRTSGALQHTAGLWFDDSCARCEFLKWEEQVIIPGGSLVSRLAGHNQLIDADMDSVLSDLEAMPESDWSRLKTDPDFRTRVENVLSTYLSESELLRAKTILDGKQESDSFAQSKNAKRSILDIVDDNRGFWDDEIEIYNALRDMTPEDVAALRADDQMQTALRTSLSHLDRHEQDLAESILDRQLEGRTRPDIVETLRIHADYVNCDERKAISDIEEALKDPQERDRLLIPYLDFPYANLFESIARDAVGEQDYETLVKPLLKNGKLNLKQQLQLSRGVNDDEKSAMADIARFGSQSSLTEEERFARASKPSFQKENFSFLDKAERQVAVNAFAQGEMRAEDKIRLALIGSGTDEDSIKAVLFELKHNENSDLEIMKREYRRKYGENLASALIADLSEKEIHEIEPDLNVRSREGDFLLALSGATDTRNGFGSWLNDKAWDGTGFQVDEGIRDLAQAMQFSRDSVSQFADRLHTASRLHASSKEGMANAIVDAGLAAAAVGAAAFTGGVSLSLIAYTAPAGALLKTGTKALLMGGDYDPASMVWSDAAGGALEGGTVFFGTEIFKVGGKAGAVAARECLESGGKMLLKEGAEEMFEREVKLLVVNSLKRNPEGITTSSIEELASKYANDPDHASRLAEILGGQLTKSIEQTGKEWLIDTAIKAANNSVDGTVGGGAAGAIRAASQAETAEEFVELTATSAALGGAGAATASVGISVAGKALEKSRLSAPDLRGNRQALDVLQSKLDECLPPRDLRNGDDLALRYGDQIFRLERGETKTIGREIIDPTESQYRSVSGKHLILSRDLDGNYYVEHMGLNATLVNSEALPKGERQRLGEFDVIHLVDEARGPSLKMESHGIPSADGFDGSPVLVEQSDPFTKHFRHGDFDQKLHLQSGFWYGSDYHGPIGHSKLRVTVNDRNDLRYLQSALFSELKNDPVLQSAIPQWKTLDPDYGLGNPGRGCAPSGHDQGAKGFILYLHPDTDPMPVAMRLDSILRKKGLSLEKPLNTGNVDTIVGSSNRVGIARDTFPIARGELEGRNVYGASIDHPVLSREIEQEFGLLPGERLNKEQLAQLSSSTGMAPRMLMYDVDGRLMVRSSGKPYGDGWYLTEVGARKTVGNLTERPAVYALYRRFGLDPALLGEY